MYARSMFYNCYKYKYFGMLPWIAYSDFTWSVYLFGCCRMASADRRRGASALRGDAAPRRPPGRGREGVPGISHAGPPAQDEALQTRSIRFAQNLPRGERIPDPLEDRSGTRRLLANRQLRGRSDRLFQNGRDEQRGCDHAERAHRADDPARHLPAVEKDGSGREEREGADEFGKHRSVT